MRYLEVRRHTMRTQPGQHLSQAGVDLARRVGKTTGPFDRVLTSPAPRAFETAIAMGFAVDEQIPEALSMMPDEVGSEIDWQAGFGEFGRVVRQGGATARFAAEQAALWRRIAQALPEGGRALLITHGGIVEAGAVGCLPDAGHDAWGASCSYCEGVRLTFDGEAFTSAEILRV